MARFNIDTCALLAEFNVSQWTARKLDKSTTDEIIHSKNAANKGAARVNKHLLAGRSELENISKHVGAVRTYFYTNTIPWSDSGIRLLPSAKFIEFDARMTQFETEFVTLVDDFIDTYPTLITAQAMALGDMFDRDEYPSADELKCKFRFAINYMPVPSAGDFRVDIGNEAQKELQTKLSKLADERIEHAMTDIKMRLKDHLVRMADRLTVDYINNEAKPRVFHNSLLDTARELCDVCRDLNITNDPVLEDARLSLYKAIDGIEVDDLRKDITTRTAVKKEVDAIRDAFSF
jgi:hypothetical protein